MNILFDEEKNVSYFYLNGNNSDKLITSDGIICDISLFKRFTKDGYNHYLKNYNDKKYDFNKSLKEDTLIEIPKREKIKSEVVETSKVELENDSEIETVEKKHRGRPKGSKNKSKEIIIESKLNVFQKIIIWLRNKFKEVDNVFVPISKLIMLVVTIGTGVLSVYYTGTYMSIISGSITIGYLVSSVMYLYGLIGTQFASILKDQKRHILAFIMGVTSILTILFSMSTSLFVNGEKYFDGSILTKQEIETKNKSTTFKFDLLKEELESNNKLINQYNDDINFQQTQNTKDVIWTYDDEHPNGYNKETGTVSLTKRAQEAIQVDKDKISELQNRNIEIRNELNSFADNGALTIDEETMLSFEDFIAKYMGFDGAWIRLFLLLFASVFVDIIGPLGLSIVRNKKKDE